VTATVHDVWTDPDLSELAEGDPRLLAVADALAYAGAVSSTRGRSARRRPARFAVGVAAIVLVAAVPTLALSKDLREFLGLISSPPVARNWVNATLTSTVPLDSRPGTRLRISWRLWSLDQHGRKMPFDGGGIFARLVNRGGTKATTATAYGHSGQYSAVVRVPEGGIGKIQVGIRGWSDGPTGKHPAPVLFPLTNDPLRHKP
jgi:hypothetical protein